MYILSTIMEKIYHKVVDMHKNSGIDNAAIIYNNCLTDIIHLRHQKLPYMNF